MSIRTERISEQVRVEVARLLCEEVQDPRVAFVNLNRAKVAPDLATAVLFWSAFDPTGEIDIDEVSEGLESVSGFLRRKLASTLQLRRTPELKFRYDPSLEVGTRTLSILRSIRNGEKT